MSESRTVVILAVIPPLHTSVNPNQLVLPPGYDGVIEFKIVDVELNAQFDQTAGGIVFVEPVPPFTLQHAGAREYVYHAVNNGPGVFHYLVFLREPFGSITTIDPTVENESPPV